MKYFKYLIIILVILFFIICIKLRIEAEPYLQVKKHENLLNEYMQDFMFDKTIL